MPKELRELRDIRSTGQTQVALDGSTFLAFVTLTNKNLVFEEMNGVQRVIALLRISEVSDGTKKGTFSQKQTIVVNLLMAQNNATTLKFRVQEDSQLWISDIKSALAAAKESGESVDEEEGQATGYYPWLYLGGHPQYSGFPTRLNLTEKELVLDGENTSVRLPYESIYGFEILPQERVSASRTFLLGPVLGAAFQKLEWYLVLRIKDDKGVSLSMTFQPMSSSVLQGFVPALYQKLRARSAIM